jgi:hypothetical protein
LADEPNRVAAASAAAVQSLFGNSRIRGIDNAYHHVLTIIGPPVATPPWRGNCLHQLLPVLAHIIPLHLLDAGRFDSLPRN